MRNKYPNTTGFFWRKELKNLKRTTLATYFKFLQDYDIPEHQRWVYNAQDWVIKFENWSVIHLLDLAHQPSDPLYTRFWSLELTDWFIDESNEVARECIEILQTRIWRQNNEKYGITPKILETFNPDKWHVYSRFYKPFKNNTLPEYRRFIPALATDNKTLPQSYITQLERSSEVTKQRLLYGNFEYDDTPWRLFSYDALLDMYTNHKQLGTKYLICDVARFGDDKAIIFLFHGFVLKEIIVIDKCSTTELVEEIQKLQDKEWIPSRQTLVDEAWVGWWVVDQLWCRGFVGNRSAISPLSKKFLYEKQRNYASLKDQCTFLLADAINENKFHIETQVGKEQLLEELDTLVQIDIDKEWPLKVIKKEQQKEKLWRSPDYADTMVMRMFFEIPSKSEEWEDIEFEISDNPYKMLQDIKNLSPEEFDAFMDEKEEQYERSTYDIPY